MLSKSEQQFLDRYKTEMGEPKWRFILRYGLAYGILMIAFTSAYDYYNKQTLPFQRFIFRIFLYLLGGLAYGAWFRWFAARRVRKIKKKLSA